MVHSLESTRGNNVQYNCSGDDTRYRISILWLPFLQSTIGAFLFYRVLSKSAGA